jgi:hypothetical protein
MLVVPLQPVPAQTVAVILANQACRINVYQKRTGLFVDLYVNNVEIVAGVIAEEANLIVRSKYLGFIGDLAFFDLRGLMGDPVYTELGDQHILMYLEASDLG